jgi:hypothetical protein
MFHFFQQIIAKIISVVAGLIISLGIAQAPVIEYKAAPPNTEKTAERITSPETEESEVKTILPSQQSYLPEMPSITPPVSSQKPENEPQAPAISLTELNEKTRKSIVNIICTNSASGSFKPITASGVIVSPKGVILTNAHIGQYFLLEGVPESGYLDCIIRKGDIAQPAYDAELVYIPSVWIEENAENIIQQEPKGTGENDYAFLLITQSIVQGKELPQNFDFTEPDFDFNILPLNFPVFLASYPAGFISGIEAQKNLGLASTFSNIVDLYTFATMGPTTLDLFSLSGNIAAQSGSSGGAAVNTNDGKLLGIITTSSKATTTAGRILNAITLPHIKRSFEKYTGKPLSYFLDTPGDYNLLPHSEFNRLKNLLIDQLNKR